MFPLLGASWVALLVLGAWIPGDLVVFELLAAVPWLGALAWIRRRPARRMDLPFILGVAVLGRAALLWAPPVLSDDVYRYVWDGRVQLAGFDPYEHAPSAPELAALRDDGWSFINHRDVRTIYPPLSQIAFRVAASLWPSPTCFRLFASLWDLAAVGLLGWLLVRRGMDARASLIHAWSPLAAVEAAVGGHIDAMAIALFVGALVFFERRRVLSGVLAGLSLATKLGAAVLLPLLARSRGRILLGLGAGLLPFILHLGGPLMPGLGEYSRRWRHNESLFAPLETATRWVAGERPYRLPGPLVRAVTGRDDDEVYPDEAAGMLARIAAAGIWLALAAWTLRRGLDVYPGALVLLTGAVLLSPVVHPWYLTWLIPLLAVTPYPPLLLLLALAPLGYFAVGPAWPRLFEYGAPGLVALLLWWRPRVTSGS